MSKLYGTTNGSEMSAEDRRVIAITVARAFHEGDREGARLFEDFARRAWGVRLSCREMFAALREVEQEDHEPDPTWFDTLLADVHLTDHEPEAEIKEALRAFSKVFPSEELCTLIETEPAGYVLELVLEALGNGLPENAREAYRALSELHGRIYGLEDWELPEVEDGLDEAA